jgi:hypothetical protein
MVNPITPKEWQDAVDAAHACLALDAARQYGLAEGGAAVDVDRCVEILERGAELGITPGSFAIERFAAELAAGERAQPGRGQHGPQPAPPGGSRPLPGPAPRTPARWPPAKGKRGLL